MPRESALPAQLLDNLFAKGDEISFGKGQIIIGSDESLRQVYLIKSGLVKLYSITNQGEEYIHIFYGRGELFPARWILDNGYEHRSILAQAASGCVVRRLPIDELTQAVQKDAVLSFAMLQIIAKQFVIYGDRLDNLEYKYASERLAYRLLFLAARFGEPHDQGVMLPALTQQDIASSINLSRESANREIERLVRKELIVKNGRRIIIKDPEGLRNELHTDVDPRDWHIHV